MRKTLHAALVSVLALTMLFAIVGQASAESQSGGNQGCTPGYWKNHLNNWPGQISTDDDYGNSQVSPPGKLFGDLVGVSTLNSVGLGAYANTTLQDALSLKGGPGLDGAAQILFRATAAAWLNAADDRINYLYRRNIDTATLLSIKTMVTQAVASGDRDQMLAVATLLDNANNGVGGCPL